MADEAGDAEHEYEFVGEVPGEVMCTNICSKVLNEPRLTDCCGQNFCAACLARWFVQQDKKNCPHCRNEDFTHIQNLPLKRKINELSVYCKHSKRGCTAVIKLGDQNDHLRSDSGCQYADIDCPNGCGLRTFRAKIKTHAIHLCPKRTTKCDHCGIEDTNEEIMGPHMKTCPDYPLVCRYKCTSVKIKRKEYNAHLAECPQAPVECPYKQVGCAVEIVRKEFSEHQNSNLEEHLLLTMTANAKASAKIEELTVKVDTLTSNIGSEVKILEAHISSQRQPNPYPFLSDSLKVMETALILSSDTTHNRVVFRLPELPGEHDFFARLRGQVWQSPPFNIEVVRGFLRRQACVRMTIQKKKGFSRFILSQQKDASTILDKTSTFEMRLAEYKSGRQYHHSFSFCSRCADIQKDAHELKTEFTLREPLTLTNAILEINIQCDQHNHPSESLLSRIRNK